MLRKLVLLGVLCMTPGCKDDDAGSKEWAQGVRAPAAFAAWQGAPSIVLPVAGDEFISYVQGLAGEWYAAGARADARLSSVPAPLPDDVCRGGPAEAAIVVTFPADYDGSALPGYVAYLDEAGVVQCVSRRFSYRAP